VNCPHFYKLGPPHSVLQRTAHEEDSFHQNHNCLEEKLHEKCPAPQKYMGWGMEMAGLFISPSLPGSCSLSSGQPCFGYPHRVDGRQQIIIIVIVIVVVIIIIITIIIIEKKLEIHNTIFSHCLMTNSVASP